ncbi:hypothetical protein UT300005_12840 [Clostridium sp. CTA-5]
MLILEHKYYFKTKLKNKTTLIELIFEVVLFFITKIVKFVDEFFGDMICIEYNDKIYIFRKRFLFR